MMVMLVEQTLSYSNRFFLVRERERDEIKLKGVNFCDDKKYEFMKEVVG